MNHTYQPRCGCTTRRQLLGWAALTTAGVLTGGSSVVIPAGAAGRNLGWPWREGAACFLPASGCPSAGLTPPFLEYDHGEGCSITGGHVYRGAAWPALRGTYLYGDFCRSVVRTVRRSPGGAPTDRAEWPLPVAGDNVVGFGEDAAGEVRAVELHDHPFFVATLFQPERVALQGRLPPLVAAFLRAQRPEVS